VTVALPAAVQLGLVAALFVVAVVVERRMAAVEPLVSVPPLVASLVGGAALMAPFVLVWGGLLVVEVVDELVVALGLSFVLWIAADRVVGVVSRGSGSC
jgi:hypothetical protein